ncbi:hypothetical protein V3390_09360 [Luteimonas sp. FXH3W]|uniref:Uncharacterized protein n=1 Tax=Aquilutibacter rugosus TaxID=3115820 RepID=A0ABU7V3M1_9GAMM
MKRETVRFLEHTFGYRLAAWLESHDWFLPNAALTAMCLFVVVIGIARGAQ